MRFADRADAGRRLAARAAGRVEPDEVLARGLEITAS